MKASPLVELQDGAVRQHYTARELTGPERQIWWNRAVDAFASYADYAAATTRRIPVMLLSRTSRAANAGIGTQGAPIVTGIARDLQLALQRTSLACCTSLSPVLDQVVSAEHRSTDWRRCDAGVDSGPVVERASLANF